MKRPRVGLIGGRRRRQGLGPFVARDLHAAGAEVPCFLTTRPATCEQAGRALAAWGVEARGYVDLERMLAAERLDAVAILSPSDAHRAALEAALEAGLHALCEKPLVWDVPDLAAETRRIAEAFRSRGLALWENCQWPHTLAAYRRLHPGALDAPPRRFEMWLQPASRGVRRLADSAPHALSLLQALAPGERPALEEVRFEAGGPDGRDLCVGFLYRTRDHAARVSLHLRTSHEHPRRAAYGVDGRLAERLVSPDGYRLSFAAGERSVPVDDPLTLQVADFVGELVRGPDPGARTREIVERMGLLAGLVGAYAAWQEGR